MKPRLLVVTKDRYVSWEMKALYRAARRKGADLVQIDPRSWCYDVASRTFLSPETKLDAVAVLGRIDTDALGDGARTLWLLEQSGIPSINGYGAMIGRDKATAATALARSGVPQPKTRILSRISKDAIRSLSYPVVVKQLIGGGGRGVDLVATPARLAHLLGLSRTPLLVQAYVKNRVREVRVIVLDGHPLTSVEKRPVPGEWKANLGAGSDAAPAQTNGATRAVAVAAARAVNADFAAVDILETSEGPLVIDVNLCPGFRYTEQTAKAGIAERLIEALIDKAGAERRA